MCSTKSEDSLIDCCVLFMHNLLVFVSHILHIFGSLKESLGEKSKNLVLKKGIALKKMHPIS